MFILNLIRIFQMLLCQLESNEVSFNSIKVAAVGKVKIQIQSKTIASSKSMDHHKNSYLKFYLFFLENILFSIFLNKGYLYRSNPMCISIYTTVAITIIMAYA